MLHLGFDTTTIFTAEPMEKKQAEVSFKSYKLGLG